MVTTSRAAVRRIAVARLISLTGGAAAYMALNYTIYQRTGSATWVAATLFLTFGTVGFVSPFTSMLGDRFDRKKVMIASDLGGAIFFFAMSLVHAPVPLLGFAFGSALAESPFLSASTAAIPNLVDEDRLGWANGLVSLGRNSGILLGPLLGGVLVATIGSGAVFAANAVTFLVSAALVATVRGNFNASHHQSEEHRGVKAGFRFVIHDRVLRTVALSWLAIVLGLGMTMVADVPLVNLFGVGSFGYGVLIACWGGGSIVGSLFGRWVRSSNERLVLVLGTGVVAATSLAVGLSPWFVFILGAVFAMGVADSLSMVAEQGLMQRRTPDVVRSRVSGAFDAIINVGMAVSYVVAGPAVAWLGPKRVYVVGGAVAMVGLLIALPILRSREDVTATVLEPAASDLPTLVVP
jgi:MFS family permease